MDIVDEYAPLPLDEYPYGSPTAVDEVGLVPAVELARAKRPASASGKGRGSKQPRRSGRSKRDDDGEDPSEEEEESKEEESEEKDGDEEEEKEEDDGEDDLQAEEEEDGGVIVEGESRDASFPGATTRNDPLYWHFQYRRNQRGMEACWLCGIYRWTNREKAAVWGRMYAEQVAPSFSLSTFVEKFVDFAAQRDRCYVVEPQEVRTRRPQCPVPNFDRTDYVAVNVRSALNAELQLSVGTYLPKSVWQVTLTAPGGVKKTWYMLWSVWTRTPRTMAMLIEAWGVARPNAPFESVDRLLGQVRVPAGSEVMAQTAVVALATGINYDAPPPVEQAAPAAPLPAL